MSGSVRTPQELVDLASSLMDVVEQIDRLLDATDDHQSAEWGRLERLRRDLTRDATDILQDARGELANAIAQAVKGLQTQIVAANEVLKTIETARAALSVLSAVLSVAVAVASGNVTGSAEAVLALANQMKSAVEAVQAA